MTRITLAVQNLEDQQLLLSLANRLKMKVVEIKEESVLPTRESIRQTLSKRFMKQCNQFGELLAKPADALENFQKTLAYLPDGTLEDLVFSLTDSGSIYFRFPLPQFPDSEVHLEVFYDQDDSDETEAVVNVYTNDKIAAKNYGSLAKAFETIRQAGAQLEPVA